MKISKDTKIGFLLEMDDRMKDLLVSLSPAFSKLSNPLLRKHVAPRVSIKDAARIGGLTPNEFLRKLEEAGYQVEYGTEPEQNDGKILCNNLRHYKIKTLDARPFLKQNKDPFLTIQDHLRKLEPDEAMEVILDFEPAPLINIFAKAGFSHCQKVADGLIYTYFFKPLPKESFWTRLKRFLGMPGSNKTGASNDSFLLADDPVRGPKVFDREFERYANRMQFIDVRGLEMPQPMMRILETIPKLKPDEALLVEHERIPRYLLPELEKYGMSVAARKAGDGHIRLIIFKEKAND